MFIVLLLGQKLYKACSQEVKFISLSVLFFLLGKVVFKCIDTEGEKKFLQSFKILTAMPPPIPELTLTVFRLW